MDQKTKALIDACDPFARVAGIINALNEGAPAPRAPDSAPLREYFPGAWPTVGQIKRLRQAMEALGWKPR